MKYLKYTGLYFMIFVIGYSVLKFIEASDFYMCMFMVGNCFYYSANLWGKDS